MNFTCRLSPPNTVYRMITVPSQTHFMYHFFTLKWQSDENKIVNGKKENLWENQTEAREKLAAITNAFSLLEGLIFFFCLRRLVELNVQAHGP